MLSDPARTYPSELPALALRETVVFPLTLQPLAISRPHSIESVNRWLRQADIDDGVKDGLTTAEQQEVVRLRRENRRLEMENEILRRAAAYFAKDQLPK